MNTNSLASVIWFIAVPPPTSVPPDVENGSNHYLIGAILAVLILVYLVYSLLKPDKF